MDIGKIAGYAAHKEVSATGVEGVFRSHARVCASQDSSKRILSKSQCGTLGNEIVTFHFSLHVAIIPFHQALKRRIRRKQVLRFCHWVASVFTWKTTRLPSQSPIKAQRKRRLFNVVFGGHFHRDYQKVEIVSLLTVL